MIPNYNHGHVIGEQLRAILSQSVQPTRIFIADDASTDDSVSTIRRLISSQPKIELICKNENSGGIALVNEMLRLADSDYVCALAADDVILPGLFEKSLTLLAHHPDAAFCSAVSYVRHHSGDSVAPNRLAYPSSVPAFLAPARILEMFLRVESWFMGNTTIYRRGPLLAAGGFDPTLHGFTDGFLCRVLALRYGACFIPEPLAIWHRYDAGLASSTVRDEDKSEQILINTSMRMATNFSDLFPVELVARSNARMLVRVLCTKLDNFEARTRTVVEAAQPIWGGSSLLYVVRWATKILKLVFFCVLRFPDIPRVALSKLWQERPPPEITQARH